MQGLGGLGRAFQRRRKRNGSSRRWAIKSKKPPGSSVLPTAPVPDNKTAEVTMEETTVTTKALSKISIGTLFSAVRNVLHKCRKTFSGFLNVFLFWRGYAQRVESLHQKVDELQREIILLHSALKLSQEVKTAGGQCEMPDGVQLSIPLPVALPPPPPPPPPPPLPPPKIVVTPAASKVPIISKTSAQTSSLKEKQNVPVAVTLRDLQTVRLRKVTASLKPQLSPEKRRSPLVTLADLQKVRLRRCNSDLSLKIRSSLTRTPTKNGLRVPLRKVNLMRSPGGTPLCNKENNVIESSLDLSMTRGLGNKHLRALTKGLSPIKSI